MHRRRTSTSVALATHAQCRADPPVVPRLAPSAPWAAETRPKQRLGGLAKAPRRPQLAVFGGQLYKSPWLGRQAGTAVETNQFDEFGPRLGSKSDLGATSRARRDRRKPRVGTHGEHVFGNIPPNWSSATPPQTAKCSWGPVGCLLGVPKMSWTRYREGRSANKQSTDHGRLMLGIGRC